MLVRTFLHLCRETESWPLKWLQQNSNHEWVEVVGISGDSLIVESGTEDQKNTFSWNAERLLHLLEKTISSPWAMPTIYQLMRMYDVYFDTDELLRDFVRQQGGMKLERVPFICGPVDLQAECDLTHCSGKQKKSESVLFDVDENLLRVIIPLSSSAVQELLFGRLRRIQGYE
jgi:hypothetical protein